MLIFVQKACFLGPTIIEIPQPIWYQLHVNQTKNRTFWSMFATSIIHPPHFPWCHVWIMNLRWVLTYDYNAFTDEKNLLRSQKKVIIHSSVGCQLGLFFLFCAMSSYPWIRVRSRVGILSWIFIAKCWINHSSKTYLAFEKSQQKLGKYRK